MYKGIKTKTTTATTKNNDNSVTTHLVLGPLKTSVHFQRVPNILLPFFVYKNRRGSMWSSTHKL